MKPYPSHFFSICIYLLFLAAGCGSEPEKQRDLAFHPDTDEVYTFSLRRFQNVLQSASTIYPETKSADTLLLDGECSMRKHKDSLTVMKFTFKELRVNETKRPGRTIFRKGFMALGREEFIFERDSLFRLLKGRSISLIFNNRGQVLGVEGIDKLQDSLSAIVQFPVYSVSNLFLDLISNDAIKDLFNLIFYNLPARIVKDEDSWGNDLILTTKAPIKYSNFFSLDKVSKDTTVILIQSVISGTSGDSGKTYLKGKRQGTSKLNNETGLPFEFQSSSETIYTTDANNIKTNQTLTVTINSKQ